MKYVGMLVEISGKVLMFGFSIGELDWIIEMDCLKVNLVYGWFVN